MLVHPIHVLSFFFFNDTAPPEIYPLPLHDALPISCSTAIAQAASNSQSPACNSAGRPARPSYRQATRSEEHTSELQSPDHLVCRLLLEKKKTRSTETRISASRSSARLSTSAAAWSA